MLLTAAGHVESAVTITGGGSLQRTITAILRIDHASETKPCKYICVYMCVCIWCRSASIAGKKGKMKDDTYTYEYAGRACYKNKYMHTHTHARTHIPG